MHAYSCPWFESHEAYGHVVNRALVQLHVPHHDGVKRDVWSYWHPLVSHMCHAYAMLVITPSACASGAAFYVVARHGLGTGFRRLARLSNAVDPWSSKQPIWEFKAWSSDTKIARAMNVHHYLPSRFYQLEL